MLSKCRYCASRTLYSLSLDGHAPKFLRKTTAKGVPIWCICITMIFPFLSFLAVGTSSGQVITWLANLTQASQIIDYICMCIIYLYFFKALKAQGWERKDLPYVGWAQPYCAYFGLITMSLTVTFYGYTTFLTGWWDVGTFFSYYLMVGLCPILFIGWKLLKKTKMVKPGEAGMSFSFPHAKTRCCPTLKSFLLNLYSFLKSFRESVTLLTQYSRSRMGETYH